MNRGIYKALFLFAFSIAAHAKSDHLLILYPKISEDTDSIKIVNRLANRFNDIERIELPLQAASFTDKIKQGQANIIALGKYAAELVKNNSAQNNSLVAMSYFDKNEFRGVSLTVDAKIIAGYIKKYLPSIKHIFVIQDQNFKTVETQGQSFKSISITEKVEVDSIALIRLLGNTVEHEANASDVVIVPSNIATDMLFEVAKVAWDKRLILMSTNLAHLDSGVMMAFYTDENAISEQLIHQIESGNSTYEHVTNVKIGLNRRVASHFNIEFDPFTLSTFDLLSK